MISSIKKNIKILLSLIIEVTFLSPNKNRQIIELIKILKFCKYSPTETKFPKQILLFLHF